ncbi:polysaccharide biosynthesis protein [Ihubacter massiliensis]|uniref:Polysaccharide biosynthesis protein n=1 Tax=Hominibacterium faecale TaxID=2839743 RepID=A0A9J6QVC8_9FIRM|nr:MULTISPECIES: polysaccharide biosynthesis protein [Eubacteriales Family XIII. Incertae Sedis]MCI7301529.1 polysaccharide biosynthesis protein [Clostridia bacterium]MDE8734003.1 polysaccharide biosynthesis protein [Eubacteriales bacterium DFI.9.88]MDY3013159.1 polysaccharide biosynthesis protein [Clostridiales Family XIII bacterium]MCO7121713.1 polysaccharide biosynthesis protein [Ihubacter massiliensis]MCU7379119.1 polysaccharide biosynthesis protein [Hominibacterium faecale]
MAKKSFVQGAAVLAVAGLMVKVLGAIFRIPLGNWIGDVGMANYNPAYYVYNFFLILATAGIPVAISRMVSERVSFGQFGEAHRVFKISRILMLAIGAVSFVVVFFGAEFFAEKVNVPGAALAMRAISPALLFVPVMASYRGYFQGMQDMKPTAISQVIEQVFRVAVGLSLAYFFFHSAAALGSASKFQPEETGAAGATLGAAAGAVGGLLVMLIVYSMSKGKLKRRIKTQRKMRRVEPSSSILKKIAIIAVPITIGAAIMPIVNLVDVTIVVKRLQDAGWDPTQARAMYGQLSAFAGSLINFPQVLTQAVAMSLVPLVAAAYKQKDIRYLQENVSTGLRMAVILGLPCALGLFALAEPILVLLYPAREASAISAAPCLMVMSVGVVFLSTVQTLTGVLQGVGKQMIPVRNLAIGVVVKIIITWTLTGIKSINILGAAAGTVTAYLIASVLNIIAVRKHTGTKFDLMSTAVKPLISSVVMAICAWGSYKILFTVLSGSRLATVAAILLAMVVYGIMVFATKTVTKEEVAKMPKGDKIVRILDKFIK